MLTETKTLEDAGWKPYWDSQGKQPVRPGDLFDVSPGKTVEICYVQPPVQDEDGKYYVNDVYLYEPFPAFIGGVYTKEKMKTNTKLGGTVNGDAIVGRIEEFAYWGSGLPEATIINYQANLTGMIGQDIGDMYTEAPDDLYYYFKFDTTSPVQNNIRDGISLKHGVFALADGKFGNSVFFSDRDSSIEIEDFLSERNFTMNIRFYLEEMKSFTLIQNNSILDVVFDSYLRVFTVKLFPYIGNISTYQIEMPNIKVHKSYDFCLMYTNGIITIIVNGEKIEEHSPNVDIGGVDSLKLNMKNIENIRIIGLNGIPFVLDAFEVEDDGIIQISDRKKINDMLGSLPFSTAIDKGWARALDILYDSDSKSFAIVGESEMSATEDSQGNIESVKIHSSEIVRAGGYWKYYWGTDISVVKIANDSTSIIFDGAAYRSGNIRSTYANRTPLMNRLHGNCVIKLSVTFKSTFYDSSEIFPLLTMFPGTKMQVKKREMRVSTARDDIKKNNDWGIHNGYPAFRNNTGKIILVRIDNSTEFIYLYDGRSCYIEDGKIIEDSFSVSPDNSVIIPAEVVYLQ